MTAAASAVSISWFLVAFVLRVAVHRRATGDSGIRRNAGPAFSSAWWARLAFITSIVAIGLAPFLVAAGWIEVLDALRHRALQWTGLGVATTGIAATFWAQLEMGRSWRVGVDPEERTELVTSGMFGLVRNPIFSTMGITALGVVLLVPTVIGIVGFLVLLGALEAQVRAVEEPYLRSIHGSAFEAYEREVGRFLPGIGRRSR